MLVAGVFWGSFVGWAAGDEVDDEFRFAAALVERGFADYGERVIRETLARHPEREGDAAEARAMLAIVQRRFEDAEALVEQMPASVRAGGVDLRLRLANAYYRADQIDRAQALYREFFDSFSSLPEDPRQRRAYEDAALFQAAILDRVGEYEAAADSLGRTIHADAAPDRRRLFESRMASLWLKAAAQQDGRAREALLERVVERAGEIEYGGAYWVAQATVLRAEAERLSGRPAEALQLLEERKESFRRIDDALEEAGEPLADSPKGGYHYVRGRILEEQGRAQADRVQDAGSAATAEAKQTLAQALNEYARVVKQYGAGPYGTDATIRMRGVEDILVDRLGATLRRTEPIQAAPRNADDLFVEADTLFRNGELSHATQAYRQVLRRFPETRATPRALTNLAKAYFDLEDGRMADVVTGYLAERFAGNSDAATGCLVLAGHFREAKDEDRAFDTYRLFARTFPAHERAPAVLYTIALAERARGREEVADRMLAELVEGYPNSQYRLRGLMAVGAEARRREDFAKAKAAFDAYRAEAPAGADRAQAWLLAGDCRLRQEAYAEAAKVFGDLVVALDPTRDGNPYHADATSRDRVDDLYRQASFQRAYALSRIMEPAERIPAFRTAAITLFERFATQFPDSELAPKALAAKGRILLELDRMEDAVAVFDQLSRLYPETPEGRSSLVTLVEAAVSAGRMDVAGDAVERMVEDPDAYDESALARVGQVMLEHREYPRAILVYRLLTDAAAESNEPEWAERAYFGLGKSLLAQGDCAGAAENLRRLLTSNPNTGYFFEAQLMLGEAGLACDDLDGASAALGEIFRLDRDADRRRNANFLLARVQAAQGRMDAAYASYLRLALHPDPTSDPDAAPLYRSSTLEAIAMAGDASDWETVEMLAEKFLSVWPGDPEETAVRQQRNRARVELSKQGVVSAQQSSE